MDEQIKLNEEKKKKFQVMMRQHPDGSIEKKIFIDNELLDWSIDISAYLEACKMGPQFKLAVQKDIERHFIDSVSEVVGRKLDVDDIKAAIASGWI